VGARLANRLLAPGAARRWPFDPDALKARAVKSTGLSDFGTDVPLDEPLSALCADLDEGPPMHPLGRFTVVRGIIGSLENRLKVGKLAADQPELFDRPVPAPLVIVGLPRSGTTLLHRLIAQDPAWRSAPFWEVNFPLPDRLDRPPGESLPRRIRNGAAVLRGLYWVVPQLRQMHEMLNDEAEEEIQLLTMGFCSAAFYRTMAGGPPRFTAWYQAADHEPAYRLFKRTLQAMQWSRPGPDRWVLKTPSHLDHLSVLRTVFPDAVLVQTHRDPVTSVVSSSSMVTYLHRGYYRHPDPVVAGASMAWFVERALRAADRDRDDAMVDVQYDRLVADPLGVVEDLYGAAGRTLDEPARQRMVTWLEKNRQHKHGVHRYAAEDFGLDVAELRKRFDFYYDRYGVRQEG
jgi:hypothetical protein